MRLRAKNIHYQLVFGEENGKSLSEHPFQQEVDWLRQFWPDAPAAGFYLLESRGDSPKRIWFGPDNHIDAFFALVYEAQEYGELVLNTTRLLVEQWDDPGDYPNAVASGPLPSYKYLAGVEGEWVYELTEAGVELYERDTNQLIDELLPPLPEGVLSVKWQHELHGNRLTLSAEAAEPDPDYRRSEPEEKEDEHD